MNMSPIKVNINPEVLQWAREEAGFTVNEIADKLQAKNYEYWEMDGKNIPLGKLKKAAAYYKRQVAVFFLPYVPEKLKKPDDFRNLKPSESNLSKEVLLVLRRAARLQHIARELRGESYWQKKYEWQNDVQQFIVNNKPDDGKINRWIREKLNIGLEDQLQWQSDNEAYRQWRLAVEEKLGILVFQFPMPMEELQGFCYTESFPYVIVTNSKQSYYGRLFTIFHELAHILRHHSGMCIMDFTNTQKQQKEEFECNAFAGKFLVPSSQVEATDDLKEIRRFANKLGVSREVYLRRMKDEGLITDTKFFTLLEQIKGTYKKKTDKSSGFVMPEVKSRASRGETLFNMVLDAVNNNRISYTEASDVLDLRINRLVHEL